MTTKNPKIAAAVLDICTYHAISQNRLAKALGMKSSNLSEAIHGKRNLPGPTMMQLAIWSKDPDSAWGALSRVPADGTPGGGPGRMPKERSLDVDGAYIKALMDRYNLRQHDIAEYLKVCDKTANKWITGKEAVPLVDAIRLKGFEGMTLTLTSRLRNYRECIFTGGRWRFYGLAKFYNDPDSELLQGLGDFYQPAVLLALTVRPEDRDREEEIKRPMLDHARNTRRALIDWFDFEGNPHKKQAFLDARRAAEAFLAPYAELTCRDGETYREI